MASAAVRGALAAYDFRDEQIVPMSAVGRKIFINQYPLVTRTPRVPIGADSFKIITHKPRDEDYTLSGDIADGATTTVSLTDVTPLFRGDVLRIEEGGNIEHIEVQEVTVTDAATGAGNLTVLRGAGGTTAAAATAAGAKVKLIGNSRFGNEINQEAIRTRRSTRVQYLQRFQHAVEVGGRVLDIDPSLELQLGDPLAQERADKFVNLYEDMERTAFYGRGAEGTALERAKAHGLVNLVGIKQTGTNPGAYTYDNLIEDMFEPVVKAHGLVDVIFATPSFFRGLHIWGFAKEGSYRNADRLGSNVNRLVVPLHGSDVTIIPCPKLGASDNITLVGLPRANLRMRVLREESYAPRGRRGDAVEGDWIADQALELLQPEQAVWIDGITDFA